MESKCQRCQQKAMVNGFCGACGYESECEDIETITIKAPIANRGEKVMVQNYRSIYKPWELGTVRCLAYENSFGEFRWRYDVGLDRKSAKGKLLLLYVGDNSIEKY